MRRHLPSLVFAVVTVVMWVGRLRNLAADGEGTQRLIIAVVMVGLGLATTAAVLVWGREPRNQARLSATVGAAARATVVLWAVRAVGIVINPDHEVGFKVVHTLLAAVSVALAFWAMRSERALEPGRAPEPV